MELTSPLQSLEAFLGGAPNATNPTYDCSFIDTYAESGQPAREIPGSKTGSLNGATDVTVCSAMGADFVSRRITNLTIYNADDASVTVTVQKDIDGTEYGLIKATLAAGYSLVYNDGRWQVSPAETSDSDSKATSNSVVISTNLSVGDSKAVSLSTIASGNTSRATSNSVIASTNKSIAASAATSNSVIISTNLSTGDSKAASNSTLISGNTSAATSNSVIISTNLSTGDSKATSLSVIASTNLSTALSAAASAAAA